MKEARPRPWAGALLGFALGLVIVGLLWLLGVVPPDRLPLFGILAISIALAMALTTQRLSAARGSTITVIVIASLLGGIALTGIPEFTRGGSLSDGCVLEGTSEADPEVVGAADTSALDPFNVSTTDTVEWRGVLPAPTVDAQVDVGLQVGGFTIPLLETTMSGSGADPTDEWAGSIDVANVLADFRDTYGFDLTGTFHFSAEFDGDGEGCDGEGYVRVIAPGAFSGVMVAVLWALLVVLLIAIIVVAGVVRRSFTIVDAEARTSSHEVPPEDTLGTGGPVEPEQVRSAGAPPSSADDAAAGTVHAGEAARRDDPASARPDAGGAARTGHVPAEVDQPPAAEPASESVPAEPELEPGPEVADREQAPPAGDVDRDDEPPRGSGA